MLRGSLIRVLLELLVNTIRFENNILYDVTDEAFVHFHTSFYNGSEEVAIEFSMSTSIRNIIVNWTSKAFTREELQWDRNVMSGWPDSPAYVGMQ